MAKKNLYPYFEAYGFFRLLTLEYDDYGPYRYEMTAEMRDRFKSEMEALVKKGKIEELTPSELESLLRARE